MKTFLKRLATRFVRDEEGASAIEYGLIAALIAVVIIGSVYIIGGELGTAFESIATQLQGASSNGGGGG